MSLPGKKRVQKLSISGPTGFVHTSHIGHDQLGSGDMVSSVWAGAGVGAMHAVPTVSCCCAAVESKVLG